MQKQSSMGVCSWSLRPTGVLDLTEKVAACGLDAVQLALDPVRTALMPRDEVDSALAGRGLRVLSGMMAMQGEDYSTLDSIRVTGGIVPDATWEANRHAAGANARIAADLGITLVTFHAGFVPHEAGALRSRLVDRLRTMADIFSASGVSLALETGQENAHTLRELLDEMKDADIGVNFDPANMILYGMGDPVDAVPVLGPYIRQVHVKDAHATSHPGEWGSEVPAGAGDVRWYEFFRALRAADFRGNYLIEREHGDNRVDDIRAAAALLRQENVV